MYYFGRKSLAGIAKFFDSLASYFLFYFGRDAYHLLYRLAPHIFSPGYVSMRRIVIARGRLETTSPFSFHIEFHLTASTAFD